MYIYYLFLYFITLYSGICSNDKDDPVRDKLDVYLNPLSKAYKEICNQQTREFFGLRDFYRLPFVYALTCILLFSNVNTYVTNSLYLFC